MTVRFVKMHGAGNDFVMIDDRAEQFPASRAVLAAIGARGTGIGCEGIILVQNSACADFRMRFFNPDGSEAELCGNGARCVAAFAREIGAAKADRMRFETLAGIIEAEILGPGRVKVAMPDPVLLDTHFVNSGVPHVIVPVENLAAVDVATEGRRIRFSDAYAPAGTNVDFVQYAPPHAASLRTYERGVEAETGACGTGAVATAVVGVAHYGLSFPVCLKLVNGCELVVDGRLPAGDVTQPVVDGRLPAGDVTQPVVDGRLPAGDGSKSHISLTGPVCRVFTGEIAVG